jgi:protein required for attachment to host cells
VKRKADKLWLVIADGEHGRVGVSAPGKQFVTTLALDTATAHKRSADLVSDRPGRAQESATTRYAIAPRHDPHAMAEQALAREVARQFDGHAVGRAFDRLVLVAPTRVLSNLRAAISTGAQTRLAGTLAKDLVKVPDHALYAHLEAWWGTLPKD